MFASMIFILGLLQTPATPPPSATPPPATPPPATPTPPVIESPFGKPRLPAVAITCRPGEMRMGLAAFMKVDNPIARALERAGPGSEITLMPGTYPSFRIGFDASGANSSKGTGGLPGRPVRVIAGGEVIIEPAGASDTITVAQDIKNGHFQFEGLTIVPGYRTGVMFTKGGIYDGFWFVDCDIIGAFDPETQKGTRTKWGISAHGLKNFAFVGRTKRAKIANISEEHALYIHNTQGDLLIQHVDGSRLGRTFIQLTSRPHEGNRGFGTVLLQDISVTDSGIARGDDYKGGTTFTFVGPHDGTVLVESCRVRTGFDSRVRHLTTSGAPYGTAALVAYGTYAGEVERLILRDNYFEFAPDAGDRALVTIGGVKEVWVQGENQFLGGAFGVALRLDLPEGTQNGLDRFAFAKETLLRGRVEIGSRRATHAERVQIGLR